MTQVYVGYEVSRRLKAFLGESAPEPMGKEYWHTIDSGLNCEKKVIRRWETKTDGIPAYQLHDLLSPAFCEAMAKKHPHARYFDGKCEDLPWEICLCLNEEYFNGGLSAVEKALMEMMEDK